MLSSESFVVLVFVFRFLMHFKFIFAYHVKQGLRKAECEDGSRDPCWLVYRSSCLQSEQGLWIWWDSSHSCISICYVRSGGRLERNSPDSFQEANYHVRKGLWDYRRSTIPAHSQQARKWGNGSTAPRHWTLPITHEENPKSLIRSQSCSHLVFSEHT